MFISGLFARTPAPSAYQLGQIIDGRYD
jgi:hypothetical protein